MGGLSSQAVRILIGVVVAVAAAIGVWLFSQDPSAPDTAASPAVTAPPAPQAAPAAAPEPAAEVSRLAPSLDLVRVEADGSATVAGLAEAGARVSLRIDGAEAAFAEAGSDGNFASLFTLLPSDAPRVLTVLSRASDGHEMLGKDSVILAPIAAPAATPEAVATTEAAPEGAPDAVTSAPAAIKVDEGSAVVINAPDFANITIDTITYQGEDIRVSGRGEAAAAVRLYLDNAEVASASIGADQVYSAGLTGIAPGTYTLRADQLNGAGKVTSRYETQITKAAPQALANAAPAPTVVQVEAGTTLWAIAAAQFGDGLMYVQVFEANRDKIRDPDLIYPGQVFEIPNLP